MYIVKTPLWAQQLFKSLLWRVVDSNEVFLTFDDGPIPEATPWVLDVLKERKMKGTFFCVADNVVKHFNIYQRILHEGHTVGNHTYHHLNAWKVSKSEYLQNVEMAAEHIDSSLFRPPYGKMTPSIAKALKPKYDVVMWDILSGDFDAAITKEKCLSNVIDHISPGSVIVFHDSLKAIEKLKYVLPRVLDLLEERGLKTGTIKSKIKQKTDG